MHTPNVQNTRSRDYRIRVRVYAMREESGEPMLYHEHPGATIEDEPWLRIEMRNIEALRYTPTPMVK